MLNVIFYTKKNCPLCDNAHAQLELLQRDMPFQIEERDIYTNDQWLEKYQLLIPFVKINDTELNCEQISFESLEEALRKEIKQA